MCAILISSKKEKCDMSKKTAVLDLTDCKCLSELHSRIKEALNFPDYYGGNWSAFWDCINRECEYEHVIIKGEAKVDEGLKPCVEKMNELLEENRKYWAKTPHPFEYEILD